MLRAGVVDSCPPCSVCEDVNAVATLSTSLPLLPEFSGKVEEQRRGAAEPRRLPTPLPPHGASEPVHVAPGAVVHASPAVFLAA